MYVCIYEFLSLLCWLFSNSEWASQAGNCTSTSQKLRSLVLSHVTCCITRVTDWLWKEREQQRAPYDQNGGYLRASLANVETWEPKKRPMAGHSHRRCQLYQCLTVPHGKEGPGDSRGPLSKTSFCCWIKTALSHSEGPKQNGIICIGVNASIWWNILQTLRQKKYLKHEENFTIHAVLGKNFCVQWHTQ